MLASIRAWIGAHQGIFASICSILFLGFIILISMRTCSAPTPGTPGATTIPNGGFFFWELLLLILIGGTVVSRDRPYLAWSFAAMSFFIFLVILGKIDDISKAIGSAMAWTIFGLPFFAGIGIWGATKTEGRMKSFLWFASGILIVIWMFLLILDLKLPEKLEVEFLKRLFPDDLSKIIFVIAFGIFLFATWKRSKVFYGIFFFVFLCFLGNAIVNPMIERFPDKLSPSQKTKDSWERGLKKIDEVEKQKYELKFKEGDRSKNINLRPGKYSLNETQNLKMWKDGDKYPSDAEDFPLRDRTTMWFEWRVGCPQKNVILTREDL